MNAGSIGYAGAFFAGILSFASPCVLPLVPAYLSFIAGVSYDDLVTSKRSSNLTWTVAIASCAFIAGFISVFVLLGASASMLGKVIIDHAGVLTKISGALVALFGLHVLGVVRLPLLQRDVRFHVTKAADGPAAAFTIGAAFGFGWTPCVGPILGTILALAANSRSLSAGVGLLACYGLGIGVPFMVAALLLGPLLRVISRLRVVLRGVELVAGSFMVITGALIVTGALANVGGFLLRAFPELARFG